MPHESESWSHPTPQSGALPPLPSLCCCSYYSKALPVSLLSPQAPALTLLLLLGHPLGCLAQQQDTLAAGGAEPTSSRSPPAAKLATDAG